MDINFQEMSSVSLRCTLKRYTTQHLFSVWHSLPVRGWTAGTLTDVFILYFCCENHRKFNPTTTAGHSKKELWWSITLRARPLTSLSWSEHQTIRSRLTGNQSEPLWHVVMLSLRVSSLKQWVRTSCLLYFCLSAYVQPIYSHIVSLYAIIYPSVCVRVCVSV